MASRKEDFVATLLEARGDAYGAFADPGDLVGQAGSENTEAQAVMKAADIALAMLVDGYKPDETAINDVSILVAAHIDDADAAN